MPVFEQSYGGLQQLSQVTRPETDQNLSHPDLVQLLFLRGAAAMLPSGHSTTYGHPGAPPNDPSAPEIEFKIGNKLVLLHSGLPSDHH